MASPVVSPTVAVEPTDGNSASHSPAGFWVLALGSIGVVYGDIGTSPLYAFREALKAAAGTATPDAGDVLGVLSLIFWALFLIVTIKYVLILLRADNHGEGGTLTLMALAQNVAGKWAGTVALFGVAGAALFYGDAIITPAISVLSAVEGLKLIAPSLEHAVVPITLVILIALFLVQSRGTARVATFFGPIMLVWFGVIAAMGVMHIVKNPAVFAALNPWHAFHFLTSHGMIGLVTLGAVFLSVTGAEALYADLGHFGRWPIQAAWLFLALPALTLNYFGQGALVLADPSTLENPFFKMAPEWGLIPLVILATAATVIASQAVITGAYSLTRQAIQLGLLPRMEIRHTSEKHSGQIFLPRINRLLLLGVLLLVLLFRTSDNLGAAYGIAVTGTMVVTAVMAFIVIWRVWGWSPLAAGALIAPFLVLDLIFLAANLLKVLDGGFVPLMIATGIGAMMLTWRRGVRLLAEKIRKTEVPLLDLIRLLEKGPPHTAPGTAVFLTSDPDYTPTALLHNLKHNHVLHKKNVIMTVVTADTPRVEDGERVQYSVVSERFSRVKIAFGYMETPNVPRALGLCRKLGWKYDIMSTSFFLSRRSLKPSANSGMPEWQDNLFITLSKGADNATDFFHIPTGRVVDLGTQVTI